MPKMKTNSGAKKRFRLTLPEVGKLKGNMPTKATF